MIRFLILLLLFRALPAGAEGPASPELLQSLEKSAGSVTTLSSDFIQEKHLSMFKNAMTSKGHVYFARPDQLRWELTQPVSSGFAIKGDKGRRWHERTGRTETFRISQEPVMKLVSEQLFAWARSDFAWLKKEYRITLLQESPVLLRLEPRSAATAAFLNHLRIGFSPDGRYVKSVELHEKDGDFTRIKFVNTVVNKQLPADLF